MNHLHYEETTMQCKRISGTMGENPQPHIHHATSLWAGTLGVLIVFSVLSYFLLFHRELISFMIRKKKPVTFLIKG